MTSPPKVWEEAFAGEEESAFEEAGAKAFEEAYEQDSVNDIGRQLRAENLPRARSSRRRWMAQRAWDI